MEIIQWHCDNFSFNKAMEKFALSHAGYCVATYVHNDFIKKLMFPLIVEWKVMEFIQWHCDVFSLNKVMEKFALSHAGYCVATYVHNDFIKNTKKPTYVSFNSWMKSNGVYTITLWCFQPEQSDGGVCIVMCGLLCRHLCSGYWWQTQR